MAGIFGKKEQVQENKRGDGRSTNRLFLPEQLTVKEMKDLAVDSRKPGGEEALIRLRHEQGLNRLRANGSKPIKK